MRDKQPRRESLQQLRQELHQDFEFIAMTLTNQAVDTNARFVALGQEMNDRFTEAGHEMNERCTEIGREMQDHFTEMGRQMGRELGRQMTDRFTQLGREMDDRYTKLGQRTDTRLRQSGADSSERFNQVVGRMRLMDQRFSTSLGAGDRDRAELRGLWQQLERRVSDLEKRFPPPGSPAA